MKLSESESFIHTSLTVDFDFWSLKIKKMIRKRPTLYEWKSAGDANVEFQFRTSSTGTDQGFKLRLRCDRK